jgi:uncharacterized protein YbaP (TraB family)
VKRNVFVVMLASLVGTGACKQAPPTPSQVTQSTHEDSAATKVDPWQKTARKRDPLKHPLFWSITKDGKTTYALGTMHIGVDAETQLPQLVWDKLDKAKRFAMETDLGDPSLAGMGKRTSGTLHDDLGPVYWQKLQDLITPEMARGVDHMKPMIPATLLSLRGLPSTPPMDGVLLGRATNQKKELVYLEAASKQAVVLEKWMDLRVLKMMLDDPDKGITTSKKMLAAYIEGDEAKIVEISDSEKADALTHGFTAAEYDAEMADILYDRNASWIEPIEKLHAAGDAFIAVGALHLLGKRSVLDLLAAKGYIVTRLVP